MCGRFTLTADMNILQESFPWLNIPEGLRPRYNIAPTQPIAAVRISRDTKRRELTHFHWGLIPSWAKDPTIGSRMINARSETAAEKPSFRSAVKYRRCLVPADGFYEWQKQPGTKTKIPMYIHMKDRSPFAFAGLWDNWQSKDGSEIRSCTIITTQPNEFLEQIHNRMPVILQPEQYVEWMSQQSDTSLLKDMLVPCAPGLLTHYAVSELCNSVQNDSPDCVIKSAE